MGHEDLTLSFFDLLVVSHFFYVHKQKIFLINNKIEEFFVIKNKGFVRYRTEPHVSQYELTTAMQHL